MAARAQRIPVVRRAEMLAELMRLKSCVAIAGTHGKTTTTSMVAALLDAGDLDPTVINGGIINAYGTNARLGAGDWMVVEADESDGTFLKLPADIAIVTNVDAEHLDHFKTFQAVQDAFVAFMENVPFYGFVVMCTDHPIVQRLAGRVVDRRKLIPDPGLRTDFFRLIETARQRANARLATHAEDREALFTLCMSAGLVTDYAALVERRRFGSFALAKQTQAYALKLLALNPPYYDARLTSGSVEYVLGSLPFFLRWFIRVDQIEGSKQKAVEHLQVVAERGKYYGPFARVLLSVIFQLPPTSASQVSSMSNSRSPPCAGRSPSAARRRTPLIPAPATARR